MEEVAYSADKEAGNAEGTLIDYLKGRGIITDLEEDKYKINVEVLLGRAGSTGNGTDGKDIYTLEKANDEGTLGKKETKIKAMTIATNPETKSSDSSIIKYDVKYYNSDGVAEKVGELVDLNKVELITFYIEGQQYTAEKGMTWGKWLKSDYSDEFVSIYGCDYAWKWR